METTYRTRVNGTSITCMGTRKPGNTTNTSMFGIRCRMAGGSGVTPTLKGIGRRTVSTLVARVPASTLAGRCASPLRCKHSLARQVLGPPAATARVLVFDFGINLPVLVALARSAARRLLAFRFFVLRLPGTCGTCGTCGTSAALVELDELDWCLGKGPGRAGLTPKNLSRAWCSPGMETKGVEKLCKDSHCSGLNSYAISRSRESWGASF